VLESFQFLVLNWSTVVEQISIYKRLRAFERQMAPVPVAVGE
jgi:peptide/bleomycin uptake transporter